MINKSALISLIALSILIGLLWRMEVEYHGWAGLKWLSYFHLAIPAGICLFLAWANFFVKLELKEKLFINILSLLYGGLIYYGLATSLTYNFAGGPSGLFLSMQTPQWAFDLLRLSILFIVPIMPTGSFLILKLFRREPTFKFLILAIAGVIISIPLSIFILGIVEHKGGHDFIHAIKNGILFPFWVFSIGILILEQRTPEAETI